MFLKLVFQETKSSQCELPTSALCALAFVISVLSVGLMIAVAMSVKATPDLAVLAAQKLDVSGVENPVTAVLLNFRSYDTLLEIAVLLIVATALLPSRLCSGTNSTTEKPFLAINDRHLSNPLLIGLLRWLVPLAILVGGYLLWTGAYSPGGAFQAGAVIAGAGVVLCLVERLDFNWQATSARVVLSLGLLVFLLVAVFSAFITGTALQYPTDYAGSFILFVELAATVSIAIILLLLFAQLKTMVGSSKEIS